MSFFYASEKLRLDFQKNPTERIGVEGFEPPIHGTKNRCLTAWLHPTKIGK